MAIQKIELSAALNSLATQTNIDKVTGMLGSSAANISKADLATVVAGLLKYNVPLTLETGSQARIYRVCSVNRYNNPFLGCIELFISRQETHAPNLFFIGVNASYATDNNIKINKSQILSSDTTSNVIYRDSDYMYIRVGAYRAVSISFFGYRGTCELTPVDVDVDDLTLIL